MMKMKKSTWIIALVIVAAIAASILLKKPVTPEEPGLGDDTTAQINEALQGINLADIDGEFEEVNAELNNL